MKLSPEATQRKALLPKWVRFFCWIFFLFLIFSPFLLLGLFINANVSLAIYGFSYYGQGFSLYALVLIILFAFLGLTGYSLLWGKKWGIYLGVIQGLIGSTVPVVTTILAFMQGGFGVPLEIILFIPWTIKMFKIKNSWLISASAG